MSADVCFGCLSAITCLVLLTHVHVTSNNFRIIYVRANDIIVCGITGFLNLTWQYDTYVYFFSHKTKSPLYTATSLIFTAILKTVRGKNRSHNVKRKLFSVSHTNINLEGLSLEPV